MRTRFALFTLLLFYSTALFAVPATPEPVVITQADGTTVTVHITGDEYSHYFLALDGTPMFLNDKGFLQADEQLPYKDEQRRRMARIAKQQTGAGNSVFPTTGSPHSLVILVGFKDVKFEQKRDDFDALLNEKGYSYNGATGSCRDYYTASSFGKFTPYFDVVGPFTLENDMAFYGGQSGKNNDANPGAMVAEACQMAAASGVNFADYDTNSDGLLDNVFIYYAGHNQAEGGPADAIWPHQSSIANRNVVLNGVRVDSYACTSEYRGYSGSTRCGIGTFCHEFGHVIGQPDFYDTDYNYYSVGDWDIMCSGSYNNQGRTPPTFTSYERFYEGWLTPTQLTLAGTFMLEPLEASNTAYLIAASEHNMSGKQPSPSEFFMLEYRDGNGWDSGLPGHGMLIWHIDYSASAWTSNTPNNGIGGIMRMHLEEANGVGWSKRANGEGGRSSDPYPGTSKVHSFTPVLHNKTTLMCPLFNIEETGGVISFVYISSGSTNLTVDKSALSLTTSLNDKAKVVDWAAQDVTLAGSSLDPEAPLTVTVNTSSKNASFKLYAGEECPSQTSKNWKTKLTLYPQLDSTLTQRVWVSFIPSKIVCDSIAATLTAQASNAMTSVKVSAAAPRDVQIYAPQLTPTEDITPFSFRINWKAVPDADQYLVNVYSVADGTSSMLQSFEEFTSSAAVELQGWKCNTTNTTSSSKKDGQRALVLKNNGDYVETETYAVPVTDISFWLNAMAGSSDTVGYINLEAFNGQQWFNLEATYITKRTKDKTLDYTFDADKNYVRFRITFYGKETNGVALDAFDAKLSKKITYVHQGDDLHVDVWDDPDRTYVTVGDLQPGTTYRYQVRCNDGASTKGGCEDNLSDFSELSEVQTVDVPEYMNDDKHLALTVDSINYITKTQVVYLSNPKSGNTLCIYDWNGALVYTIKVVKGVYEYPIPTEKFVAGAVYTIKYIEDGKMTRKQRVIKAIFNK